MNHIHRFSSAVYNKLRPRSLSYNEHFHFIKLFSRKPIKPRQLPARAAARNIEIKLNATAEVSPSRNFLITLRNKRHSVRSDNRRASSKRAQSLKIRNRAPEEKRPQRAKDARSRKRLNENITRRGNIVARVRSHPRLYTYTIPDNKAAFIDMREYV